mgnify:CR=1 FL=1
MNVLFISHDSNLTGAPIILLELIKQFKLDYPSVNIEIISANEGELTNEFKKFAPLTIWHVELTKNKILNELYNIIRRRILSFKYLFKRYDIVLYNTICCFNFLEKFKSSKNVLYTLEMRNVALECAGSRENYEKFIRSFNHIICANKIIEQTVKLLNDNANTIVIEGFYRFNPENKLKDKKSLVIGSCGDPSYRKGFDIFLDVAKEFEKRNLPIKFVWVGNNNIVENSPTKNVTLIPKTNNPIEYFKQFDVFLLASREDPFPLVVIENAVLGTPIVCFNQNNGVYALIESSNSGITVPFLAINKLVDAIVLLFKDKNTLLSMSLNAKSTFTKYELQSQNKKTIEFIVNSTS